MKLLTEKLEGVEYLIEGAGADKKYYITGIFIQTEQKNRNGRVYPKSIMEREVHRYTNDYIKENRAFGELGHPSGPGINLHLASHLIKDLREDKNDYIGIAKIIDTPNGKIVKTLIDEGAKIGVSTRALGSLTRKEGIDYVNEDLHLATAGDIVADPSAPDAFVRGIMEGVEWVQDPSGVWVSFNEQARKSYDNAHKIDKTATKARIFEAFMNRLAKGV